MPQTNTGGRVRCQCPLQVAIDSRTLQIGCHVALAIARGVQDATRLVPGLRSFAALGFTSAPANAAIGSSSVAGNYGDKPEVKQAIQVAKSNAEMQLYLKDNVKPAPVTDAQVKARYDEIVASLGKEEVKPRIIVAKDAATAATALAQLKSGQSFEALARQYSQAPTAAAGGELPWISFKTPAMEGKTQGLPLFVAQVITKLPVGAVTLESIPLTNDVNGPRAIVKVDAKRPTQVPTFDAAKPAIQKQLQALALEKASAQFVGGLLKNATIQQ